MAPDADIYDYRALGQDGSGSYEQIAAAVNEAVADGCDIINMSLGEVLVELGVYTGLSGMLIEKVLLLFVLLVMKEMLILLPMK